MSAQLIIVSDNELEAHTLSKSLHLPVVSTMEEAKRHHDYAIVLQNDVLSIHALTSKKMLPFFIDFNSTQLKRRRQQAGLKNEMLARAIGIHPKHAPTIIDATAGLGRDSFILASLGYHLTLLERSPLIHALLENALKRAEQDEELKNITSKMQLILTDAVEYFNKTEKKAEVIYLDPMFPERQKSALVKKEMVMLQAILGKENNDENLLTHALSFATKRVVVKRPKHAPYLLGLHPNFSYTGKSSRFDIYLVTHP